MAVIALHNSQINKSFHCSRISQLETVCHGLRQQLEELRMFTSMLERREAERIEVSTLTLMIIMMMMMMCYFRSRPRRGWPR